PWIFAQLHRWEKSGHPGAAPGYEQHLRFLERHFHLVVADRGERCGCLLFRKVANWYCRVLQSGWEIQRRFGRIASVEECRDILNQLRNRAGRWTGPETACEASDIAVPRGPVEHW